jgi:hypothetical protein
MPTLKRHKCRAPVAFHAFMNTRCVGGLNTIIYKRHPGAHDNTAGGETEMPTASQ